MASGILSRSVAVIEIIILLGVNADLVTSSSLTPTIEKGSVVKPTVNPPCGIIQWSCASVSIFNKCFMNKILSSPTLYNLFDLTKLTQKEEAGGLFYVASVMIQNKQDNRSPFVANLVVRDLAESKNPLTVQVMGSAYANGVSKFLHFKRVLNHHNACPLAEKYADYMLRSANRVTDNCIPKSKVSAVSIGYEDYMDDLGLFTKENNLMLALFFSNEFLYQRDFQNPAPVYNAPLAEDPQDNATQSIDFPFREDLCDFSPPEVKAFNNAFQSVANESAILRNLFDVKNVSIHEFSSCTFHNYQYHLARAWSQGSAQLAQTMSSSLEGINGLSFELALKASSSIVSKFLYSQKRLTVGNANGLAKTYSKMLEDATLFIVDSSFINSKTMALISGFVNFLKHLGLFTSVNGPKVAFYFANEWRCLSRHSSE